MIQKSKVFGMLGLAMKSGNVVSGEYMTEQAVRSGAAKLVIVAEDASANTKKKFMNSCFYYKVPIFVFGEKEEMGNAIGRGFRASLAVLDQGFASSISKNLDLEEM